MTSTLERPRALDMLLPSGLLASARALSLPAFASRPEARRILLVRVQHERELLDQLRRSFGVGVRLPSQPQVLDFRSAVSAVSGITGLGSGLSLLGRHELLEWIGVAPCFAVPVLARGQADADRVRVGRARNADLSLRTQSVSRQHAELLLGDLAGQLEVVDRGSHNGTFVNGERAPVGQAVTVHEGDELRLGRVELLFCPVDLFWSIAQRG